MVGFKDIHSMMGILTLCEQRLARPEGVQVEENASNLIFLDGAIFIIDSETGKAHQATIHIKSNPDIDKSDFQSLFKKILTGRREDSRKIHLTKCSTIEDMIKKDGFHKYHGSNHQGHERIVKPKGGVDTSAPLKVCKNCIQELDLRRKMGDVPHAASDFNFSKFFDLRIGVVPAPEKNEDAPADDYPPNWRRISDDYRERAGWKCQECGVDFSSSDEKHLLHVHHKNKRKADIRPENLQVLCEDCHRKQPYHGHMSKASMPYINRLRKEQGLG